MALKPWLIAIALAVGCDNNDCGPDMSFDDALGVCRCDDHSIAEGGGCTPCADDEIVVGTTCGCSVGESKSGAGVCARLDGQGSSCEASTSCSDATYDYCAVRDGSGVCTNKCVGDSDCSAGYVCADWEATPSCRTFTGYGAACSSLADCAGFDANYCIQGACDVHGCTVGVDDCPRDTKCCDFSSYGLGTLCAPAENCS
jgi:hypothetical protein